LGEGLGMHVSYLSEALSLEIFQLARNNRFFALGLGEGCGILFPYLSQNVRDWLASHVSTDGFPFGFGMGIGKIRSYLDNDIFAEAAMFAKSINFVKGFALGLGRAAANLPKDSLLEILSRTELDEPFAQNFGFAVGHSFSLLGYDKKKEIQEAMRHTEEYFLEGLGEGLGHHLPSTGSRLVEEAMKTIDSVSLTRGVARGIAESFKYLNLAEVLRMLEYASFNSEYGRVLGEGLADKFTSLDEEKQSCILDTLQKDSSFSRTFAKINQKNHMYISSRTLQRIKSLEAKFPHLELAHEKKN
jgi:hypothetical protein